MQPDKAFRRADEKLEGSVVERSVFAASQEAAQEEAEAAQLKSQLENLLEVKEQIQRFVFAASQEAADAA